MTLKFIDKIIDFFSQKRYENEEDYLNSILSVYKNKYSNYEEFRMVAHKAIEALLKENKYKYQVMSRTKTHDRLKEKLIRKKQEGKYYNSLEEIEDLVGIRIIFYTEHDKEKFLKEIRKEISGLMKLEERIKDNGYKATHLIMSFGPKRLKLGEYKHFNGLKSEIQITSILHHAWSEIEHDLIYKDVHGFKNQSPEEFEKIKVKMKEIMEKYIEKAAKELEELIHDKIK